jgi:hypothetical protein
MLIISFSGWAQCRLATDPDPYDDPRGVSGYMRAYAAEPDLDRIIRFQDPPFARAITPDVGVFVRDVVLNGVPQNGHPLVGAAVDLAGRPVFEGRNGVVAEDAEEPIYPFHIVLRRGPDSFSRATVATDQTIPAKFREFKAVDFQLDAGFMEKATGISDLRTVWRTRLETLELQRPTTPLDQAPSVDERISFLRQNLQAGGGAARFFPARMVWDYAVRSDVLERGGGIATLVPGFEPTRDPWRTRFWFGGWDADAQVFFVSGDLEIGDVSASPVAALNRRPERMTDVTESR